MKAMANKKWTPTEDSTLQRMAIEGASLYDISEVVGRSPIAVILRARLLSGLERPDSQRKMSDDYYDQTKTISQVATEFGRRWSKSDNEMLLKRFYNGVNIYQLAEHFNRTPKAIIFQLEKLNSRPEEMEALFNRARQFFGKKKVVRRTPQEQPIPTHVEQLQKQNEEMISSLRSGIQESETFINKLKEVINIEEETVEGDIYQEIENELKSKHITDSDGFRETMGHLSAVIDYINKTELDINAKLIIGIELMKGRQLLQIQDLNRRLRVRELYAQQYKSATMD